MSSETNTGDTGTEEIPDPSPSTENVPPKQEEIATDAPADAAPNDAAPNEAADAAEAATAAAAAAASTSSKKKILLEGDEDDVEMDMDDITETPSSTNVNGNGNGNNIPLSTSTTAISSSSVSSSHSSSNNLIPQIITPSPFQHHNDSATSDRYRSALQRITNSPLHDVEAWEAIMTECMSLYRTQLLPQMEEDRKTFQILRNAKQQQQQQQQQQSQNLNQDDPNKDEIMIRNTNIDLEKKLDWVESCHGHLLHNFPYTASYYVSVVEVLLARGALPFESLTGGDEDFSFGIYLHCTHTQQMIDRKIDRIFERILGVKMDGTPAAAAMTSEFENDTMMSIDDLLSSSSTNNVTATTATATTSPTKTSTSTSGSNTNPSSPTQQALLGGMCTSSIDLWQLFIRKRTRDAKRQALQNYTDPNTTNDPNKTKITPQGEELIRDWIIGAYETALSNGASFVYNNDVIWKQYLTYVKAWNIMTTNTTTAEVTINHLLHSKQKELLRSIYQRIITLPMTGLDSLWTEYEIYEKAQSEQLATALIAEHMPKYTHARSVYLERNRVYNIHDLRMGKVATPPADYKSGSSSGAGAAGDDSKAAIIEEMQLLSKWKRRCAYERTNPERLPNAELAIRVRQCFKDVICAFMRHIEVWHEWCMWELYNMGGGGSAAAATAASNVSTNGKKRNVQFAIAVLTLAQHHIPDCTLLAYAHSLILENQVGGTIGADEAIDVMAKFCNRAGNTLGYVLLQRLVRKYKGIKEARKMFAIPRRVLRVRVEDVIDIISGSADGISSEHKGDQVVDDAAKSKVEAMNGGQDAAMKSVNGSDDAKKKKLVITRDTFHTDGKSNGSALKPKIYTDSSNFVNKKGIITWHLYASHASIEHRVNKLPQVAAKVYELGLRKHRTFLATPQYVLQYCSLLLELGDEENLRALLTRSIAACEEEFGDQADDIVGAGSSSETAAAEKRDKQRPLWDMMLMFESIVSTRSGDQTSLLNIEARRRNALYGPENEDVSGGAFLNESDVGIGAQKISLSDTLIRSDGYDVSSRIVNGLDRMVNSLEISGILGKESNSNTFNLGSVWKDDGAGGLSDASFRRRQRLQAERSIVSELSASGLGLLRNAPLGAGITGSTSGKLLSAKERLAQNAWQNQNMTVAAGPSPEWLRGMISRLPPIARNYRGAKAPPHMIEMALVALRDNALPSTRPSGSTQYSDNNSTKRKRNTNDGDSSDDENGLNRGGGYGNQFRARQRAKMMTSNVGKL